MAARIASAQRIEADVLAGEVELAANQPAAPILVRPKAVAAWQIDVAGVLAPIEY